MKRARLRKWAKWACTVAAGATAAAAVFSRFAACGVSFATGGGETQWTARLAAGQLAVERTEGWLFRSWGRESGWNVEWAPAWHWGYAGEVPSSDPSWAWHDGVAWDRTAFRSTLGTNMLYPVLLTSLPAALLRYADRRRFGPGRCAKCGYDRRGLAAAVKCPECGTAPTAG